jgi:hypothetical protein
LSFGQFKCPFSAKIKNKAFPSSAFHPDEPTETNMIKFAMTFAQSLVAGAFIATLFGCQKEEGPAERAGKTIDKAVESAGQQLEKAGEKIQDAAKEAKK